MYAVTVRFTIHQGKMPTFLPLMLANAGASRGEIACRQFDVCYDPERPDEVFLYELYDDRAGFEAHLAAPHFMAFRQETSAMIAGKDERLYPQVAR